MWNEGETDVSALDTTGGSKGTTHVLLRFRRTRHAGHCWRSRDELISDILLWTPHMAGQKQDDQLEHTYSSYVGIRDVALKTCQRRWTIGRRGEKWSGISVPVARPDDDDDDHTFPNGICQKVNVIVQLGFEISYYDSAIQPFYY